jgi:hypothetical protein
MPEGIGVKPKLDNCRWISIIWKDVTPQDEHFYDILHGYKWQGNGSSNFGFYRIALAGFRCYIFHTVCKDRGNG